MKLERQKAKLKQNELLGKTETRTNKGGHGTKRSTSTSHTVNNCMHCTDATTPKILLHGKPWSLGGANHKAEKGKILTPRLFEALNDKDRLIKKRQKGKIPTPQIFDALNDKDRLINKRQRARLLHFEYSMY